MNKQITMVINLIGLNTDIFHVFLNLQLALLLTFFKIKCTVLVFIWHFNIIDQACTFS